MNNVEKVHRTLLREEEFNSETIMLNKQRIILPGDIQHVFDSLIFSQLLNIIIHYTCKIC